MDPRAVLTDLDADQQRAVATESQLVAVIAGAGSGKTRVLTRRGLPGRRRDRRPGSHPGSHVHAQAARELRRRLPRLGLTGTVTAGTFHSVAQTLLRQRWADRDQAPRSIVTDRHRIVGDVMGKADLDELIVEMNWSTARGVGPDQYEAIARRGDRRSSVDAGRVALALRKYAAEKRSRGVVDLDDLLSLTIEALSTEPEFASVVRWRFRHLLVDEAQDLNPLQHRFLDLLRQGRDDLFLVGDPAQAIYGFNGSDPKILLDVEENFPGIEVVRLPVNYRCTPQIVDAGAHALRAGEQPTRIESARADGTQVRTIAHDDEHAEAAWVAGTIARLDPTAVRTSDVAVLGRTHAVLQLVRLALADRSVALKRNVDGIGSPLTPFLTAAYRLKDHNRLRQWAHDEAEMAESTDVPR